MVKIVKEPRYGCLQMRINMLITKITSILKNKNKIKMFQTIFVTLANFGTG